MFLMTIVALAPAISAGSNGMWSASDLEDLAAKVRASKPIDQFDSALEQSSVNAAQFSVEIPVRSIEKACFGYPYWDYSTKRLLVKPGGETLSLNTFLSEQGEVSKKAQRDVWGEQIKFYAFTCTRSNLPSYRASNAYGAKFDIDPTLQTVTAIADDPRMPTDWPEYLELAATGDEARQLVQHLKVRFTGVLKDWRPGVAVACGYRHDGPTASSPYDRNFARCLYNGRIERIDIVDGRTDGIVASATRQP